MAHDQVVEGIRTEMVQLETLEVGNTFPEKKGRTIAVEHEVQILTARWVFTQKIAILCRARLVCPRLCLWCGKRFSIWHLCPNK